MPSGVSEDAVRKKQDVAGEGVIKRWDNTLLEQPTNLAVAPEEKQNMGQFKEMNEVTVRTWAVCGWGNQGHQRPLKLPTHFQKSLKEQTVYDNSFA